MSRIEIRILVILWFLFVLVPAASAQKEKSRPATACDSMISQVLSQLNYDGTAADSFNRAFDSIQGLKEQLATACAANVKDANLGSAQCERAGGDWDATRRACQKFNNKLTIFGGTIEQVHLCWNGAIYYKLADGTEVAWTDETNAFKRGAPSHVKEFLTGITDRDYYCLAQKVPMLVWAVPRIKAMRYRSYLASDESRRRSDLAKLEASTLDELNKKISSHSEQIASSPKNPSLLASRGNLYLQSGDYGRALADFNESAAIRPDDSASWSNRCWARAVANQELNKALEDANEALRLKPNDRVVFNCRGLVKLRQGRYSDAIADYDIALGEGNWNTATAWYGRALAELQSHNEITSVLDFGAATAVDPAVTIQFTKYGFPTPGKLLLDFEAYHAMNAIEMAPLFDAYVKAFYGALGKPDGQVSAMKLVNDSLKGMWEAAMINPADFSTSKICGPAFAERKDQKQEVFESLRCFLLVLDQVARKIAPEQDIGKYKQIIRGAMYGLENSTR
jgi:tetratricopeptide (TPR) repeat protein